MYCYFAERAMAWQKPKQYDPAEAFIENDRQQKLLDLNIQSIDKLLYSQLKLLSRDRLETTSELLRLETEKSQLAYFDETMEVRKMKEFTDGCLLHMKQLKRELSHDNFHFENPGDMHLKRTLHGTSLPKLEGSCFVTQSYKSKNKKLIKKPDKNYLKRRRTSNLMKSKIFSISDSHLETVSKYKHNEPDYDKGDTDVVDGALATLEIQGAPKTIFPNLTIKATVRKNSEQHRYFKDKLATALVLPTVTEVTPRQRKLSV